MCVCACLREPMGVQTHIWCVYLCVGNDVCVRECVCVCVCAPLTVLCCLFSVGAAGLTFPVPALRQHELLFDGRGGAVSLRADISPAG